jgi:hypothetical protein
MPRKLLLFAALAVVGSMLVLYFAIGRDGNAESKSEPLTKINPDPNNHPRPSLNPQTTTPSDSPPPSDPSRPSAGTVAGVERGANADKAGEPPLEYTLPDGRKVRDFRDPSKRVPLDMPPSIHPPGGRKIKPELTGLFTDQILAVMHECGKTVAPEALGVRPRLEGQIVIAIKQAKASVTSAVFKVTNLNSESVAQAQKDCIEQKSVGVTAPAADEQDLDAYSINLSFSFP